MFSGFTEDTERFFLDLRFHNNKEFLHANEGRYLAAVRDPLYAMIEELGPEMRCVDPLLEIRPHRCLSRINRDVRFTKDKSPYRDCMWFLLRRAGEQRYGSLSYCFYIGIHDMGWGLCVNGENKPLTELFRSRMEAEPAVVKDIIDQCRLPERGFFLYGKENKRMEVPVRVPEALKPWYRSKVIELYRMQVPYEWALEPGLTDRVREDFLALGPVYHLLRGMLDQLPPLEDERL